MHDGTRAHNIILGAARRLHRHWQPLAHAEQASASRLLETCLENLSISAMQLGALSKSQDQAASQSQVRQLQPCLGWDSTASGILAHQGVIQLSLVISCIAHRAQLGPQGCELLLVVIE